MRHTKRGGEGRRRGAEGFRTQERTGRDKRATNRRRGQEGKKGSCAEGQECGRGRRVRGAASAAGSSCAISQNTDGTSWRGNITLAAVGAPPVAWVNTRPRVLPARRGSQLFRWRLASECGIFALVERAHLLHPWREAKLQARFRLGFRRRRSCWPFSLQPLKRARPAL